jgi:AcrR family transcriptional regulator
MIWKSDRGSRGYHHGNLKEALIRAALELIAAKGPSGFTFAEAARSAGVSPAAPYRHFRDREELLANVARRGFEQFEATLKAAWKDGVPDPFSAFERLGRAYLAFARTEPAYAPTRCTVSASRTTRPRPISDRGARPSCSSVRGQRPSNRFRNPLADSDVWFVVRLSRVARSRQGWVPPGHGGTRRARRGRRAA